MKLGLVNFQKKYDENKVIDYRNQKIASLMNILFHDLNQYYSVVELNPYSQIILNIHLEENFSPLRFYSLEELESEIYFFMENMADLEYANSFIESKNESIKKFFLKQYINSISILPEEFFEPILNCPVALE